MSDAFVAYDGMTRIGQGGVAEVLAAARAAAVNGGAVLVFDLDTGRVVDLDLRDLPSEPVVEPARRGRPKLGVTAREVTLLPRHWDWLAAQPGGASVALRKLVEAARKADPEGDLALARRDAAYRFMSAMAGDLPGFEEASRALFAGNGARLSVLMASWPGDIADQVSVMVSGRGSD
ncbi:DUF2239 family protein [soil metagenome]